METPNRLALLALAGWYELQARLTHERGQALAEYSLLLTLVAIGVVVPTLILFRGALASAFDSVRVCLASGC